VTIQSPCFRLRIHAGGHVAAIEGVMYPGRPLGVVVMGNVNDDGVGRVMTAAAAILSKEGH
jgi:hypothetical protein